jgi:hypothetical protein
MNHPCTLEWRRKRQPVQGENVFYELRQYPVLPGQMDNWRRLLEEAMGFTKSLTETVKKHP